MAKRYERKKYQGNRFYYGINISNETKQEQNKFSLNI